jgi:hypothetical protein
MNSTVTLSLSELRAIAEALECPLCGDEEDALAVFGTKDAVKAARAALRIVSSAIVAATYRRSSKERKIT